MGDVIWPGYALHPVRYLRWICGQAAEDLMLGLPQDSLYPIWADFLPGS